MKEAQGGVCVCVYFFWKIGKARHGESRRSRSVCMCVCISCNYVKRDKGKETNLTSHAHEGDVSKRYRSYGSYTYNLTGLHKIGNKCEKGRRRGEEGTRSPDALRRVTAGEGGAVCYLPHLSLHDGAPHNQDGGERA